MLTRRAKQKPKRFLQLDAGDLELRAETAKLVSDRG
jgi:hypothetical protein